MNKYVEISGRTKSGKNLVLFRSEKEKQKLATTQLIRFNSTLINPLNITSYQMCEVISSFKKQVGHVLEGIGNVY